MPTLAKAVDAFVKTFRVCTRAHAGGWEVVHPLPLREAADDLSNAMSEAHKAEWAAHGSVQQDGPHSTGQMPIGRGRGADAKTMAAFVDLLRIVMYQPGELPGKRWPEGHVFDAEILAALDRARGLVGLEEGEGDDPPAPKTHQQVRSELLDLRAAGEPFTSRRKLAELLRTTPPTISKAIDGKGSVERCPELQGWEKRHKPKARQGTKAAVRLSAPIIENLAARPDADSLDQLIREQARDSRSDKVLPKV